ncbi:coiled-coil domain-containing protein 9-like [Amphibalanus amphitrite]|uniref:coiled-coil domain-containing protein 9-like n=1 Tax=Amphibalanus amphitrite TaxID=1232801 RepID=UPI001C9254EB|nr:coiled-coil domain-containing protein 9-like [Amphibalanus amphitrite]
MAKAREKDAEAALDAKIRRIQEENRLREQRKQEVEADRQQARASGSDEARVSKCVRYRRSPSPQQEQPEAGRRGGRDRVGAGFLRDRARDCPERGGGPAAGGRGERDRRQQNVQQQQQQRKEDAAWRLERQQIDQRRVERSKASDGGWRREWDREKQANALREEPKSRRGGGGGDGRAQRQRSPPGAVTGGALHRPPAAERPPAGAAAGGQRDSRSECYSVDMKGRDLVFTYSCSYIS